MLDKLFVIGLFFLKFLPTKRKIINLPESIGIIKLSAMGDIISLLPSIRELKKIFPDAKITWITTNRVPIELFRNCKLIDDIVVLRLRFGVFFKILNLAFNKVSICFDFDQYYRISEILSFLISGGKSVGFSTKLKGKTFLVSVDYDNKLNEKIMFSKLVEKTYGKNVEIESRVPELLSYYTPPNKVKIFLRSYKNKRIFVYAGSSYNAIYRRWALENYLKLADIIKDYFPKFEIIFVGGANELGIKKKLNDDYTEIINEFTLKDMLYIFTKGELFIGNDAGLLHLAEAAGLKSVSIFGPNLYSKWGSLLTRSKGVEISISCRPCIKQYQGEVPTKCKKGDVKCLKDISIDLVFNEVKEVLTNN